MGLPGPKREEHSAKRDLEGRELDEIAGNCGDAHSAAVTKEQVGWSWSAEGKRVSRQGCAIESSTQITEWKAPQCCSLSECDHP